MNTTSFLEKLRQTPEAIAFTDTIATIEENYTFTPTTFHNGSQINTAGENSGSCKIFAFAQLQNLTEAETLACFGAYYFDDVLKNPEGTDHQNIRNFMKTGWNGIRFDRIALISK
ncbi:HopJ type III effector protein [Flavobacterium sp. ZT3R25]|uniref:HopJ type III effector protein n=1 Tax=Flavobacterium galactosi TaxID=3398735 RepID=UPI003A87ECC8